MMVDPLYKKYRMILVECENCHFFQYTHRDIITYSPYCDLCDESLLFFGTVETSQGKKQLKELF